MSASAGKVMPRPMGDYNALTEYKILDIVTYNNRPYMAKQTTTGNLPTNTTYWMNLLDFPTEVDNVPTQNSQNLVYSGGVYSSLADKMNVDGSNIENLIVNKNAASGTLAISCDVSKPAGDNQTVTIVCAVSDGMVKNKYARLKARIGDESMSFLSNGNRVAIVIDTVTESATNEITLTAHLQQDTADAISITGSSLYGGYFVAANEDDNVIAAPRGAVNGSRNIVVGLDCATDGDYISAFGRGSAVTNDYSAAHGYYATATASYSEAHNNQTVAGYSSQFVVGKNNNNKSGTLFEVGAGTGATSRVNAFEVYSDGKFSQNDGTDKYKFAKSGGIDGFYDSSNNFHPFYKELVNNSVTLSTSADTTVTFTDSAITANSTIEPFTSVYSIAPKDCVASAGQCVVTIPKQSTAQTIKVKIRVS